MRHAARDSLNLMTDFDERCQRKRKFTESERDDVLRALLLEEIDLEIGLRSRVKETVEARLNWALLLQDALEKHLEQPDAQVNRDTPNRFADLAIAAHKATKEPLAVFLPTEPPEPSGILDNHALLAKPNEAARSPVQEFVRPRHATRPHVQLHHEDRVVKEPNKFLFLRDTSATPTMVYKIACPDCHRSDFPRLQGLLNHCRLKHHREFGSHDECVQACAVVVPEEEQAFVIEHGLEVTGMSASLQRLFKMAVGSYEGIVTVPETEEAQELAKVVQPHTGIKYEEDGRGTSTLLTKTLGHHKDTPALAPFLGRAPKKREIRVFDTDMPIDVLGVDDNAPKCGWRKTYTERSFPAEATEEKAFSEDNIAENTLDPSVESGGPLRTHEGSRFHFPVRLIVTDYSMRLPTEETNAGDKATHKWMVSVSTASYSIHASTVLAKMTVTSATEHSPSTFVTPLSVSEPPYSIMATTDKPFLARILLEWLDTRNSPTHIEHWVELDMGKSTRPVKGDEQVLDIELDRHTELQPRRGDTWVVKWSDGLDKRSTSVDQETKSRESPGSADPEHIKRLKRTIQRFPMTVQDSGPRKIVQVPYFLPFTTQHFESLVEGRRRAIEWGRARAVWDEFISSGVTEESTSPSVQFPESNVKFSGPMDIYRWMVKEGHFPRSAQHAQESAKRSSVPDLFCAFCGLRLSAHRKAKGGRAKDSEDGVPGRVCEQPSWAGSMPIVDVQEFRALQPQTLKRRALSERLNEDAHIRILQTIDPALIRGVQRAVSDLRLPCFAPLQSFMTSGIILSKEQCERELAPYALLAASARAFIRLLVHGGLQVMDAKSENAAKQGTAGSSGPHGAKKRLLIPAHILRGLVEGSRRKGAREMHRALLLSMARLGVAVHDSEPVPPPMPHVEQIPACTANQNEDRLNGTK